MVDASASVGTDDRAVGSITVVTSAGTEVAVLDSKLQQRQPAEV